MPSAEERERSERSEGSGAPLTPNTFRDMAAVIDIFRTLGRVTDLEVTTKSHAEKIEQLIQWGSAIPHIEKDVAQNTKDLNDLGGRHTKELNELGQRLDKNANELGTKQTKDLNELGIRLGNEIGDLKSKDIGDLKNKMHTAENLFRIFLGILAVVVPLVWIYLSHHVSIVFRP